MPPMDHYEIWVNLAPGESDLEFVEAVRRFLDRFVENGEVEGYAIRRRKFGFGPEGLGEFNVSIRCRDLAQLDQAFHHAATRAPEIESLHREVFRRVCDFRSGLYRDFPDPERVL